MNELLGTAGYKYATWSHKHPRVTLAVIVLIVLLALLVSADIAAQNSASTQQASHNSAATNSAPAAATSAPTETTAPDLATPSAGTSSDSTNSVTTQEDTSMNSSNATVTVNGQNIPLPDNGSVQKTIVSPDDGSKTNVNIDVQHSTSGTSSSHQSSHLNVTTNSSSRITTDTESSP